MSSPDPAPSRLVSRSSAPLLSNASSPSQCPSCDHTASKNDQQSSHPAYPSHCQPTPMEAAIFDLYHQMHTTLQKMGQMVDVYMQERRSSHRDCENGRCQSQYTSSASFPPNHSQLCSPSTSNEPTRPIAQPIAAQTYSTIDEEPIPHPQFPDQLAIVAPHQSQPSSSWLESPNNLNSKCQCQANPHPTPIRLSPPSFASVPTSISQDDKMQREAEHRYNQTYGIPSQSVLLEEHDSCSLLDIELLAKQAKSQVQQQQQLTQSNPHLLSPPDSFPQILLPVLSPEDVSSPSSSASTRSSSPNRRQSDGASKNGSSSSSKTQSSETPHPTFNPRPSSYSCASSFHNPQPSDATTNCPIHHHSTIPPANNSNPSTGLNPTANPFFGVEHEGNITEQEFSTYEPVLATLKLNNPHPLAYPALEKIVTVVPIVRDTTSQPETVFVPSIITSGIAEIGATPTTNSSAQQLPTATKVSTAPTGVPAPPSPTSTLPVTVPASSSAVTIIPAAKINEVVPPAKLEPSASYHITSHPLYIQLLPPNLHWARVRIGIDVGGTLAKICYFAPTNPLPSEYLLKQRLDEYLIFPSNPQGLSTRRAKELELQSPLLGGTLHFVKFETTRMPHFFDLVNLQGLGNIEVFATGGGAHKYRDKFLHMVNGAYHSTQDEVVLGSSSSICNSNDTENAQSQRPQPSFQVVDEMAALVRGVGFLIRHSLQECFSFKRYLFHEELEMYTRESPAFPFLLVNIGSGVSILRVDNEKQYTRVGGTSIGGGTFLGLCRALAGCTTFHEALSLAHKGKGSKVDLLVHDIYGRDYSALGLSGDTIAASFGKLVRLRDKPENLGGEEDPLYGISKEDLAKAALVMITNNICSLAHLYARQVLKIPSVVFVGNFLRNNILAMRMLSYALAYWSNNTIEAIFLKHEGYFGSIGSMLPEPQFLQPDQLPASFVDPK